MLCEYQVEVVAKCPVDNCPDLYRCTVRSRRIIPVETILKAIAELNDKPRYQEEFTERLHRSLAAQVETTGHHSGVKTRCVCGELDDVLSEQSRFTDARGLVSGDAGPG